MDGSKARLTGTALGVSGDSKDQPPPPTNTCTTSSVVMFTQGLLGPLLPPCHAEDTAQLHTVSAVKEFCRKEELSQKCTNHLFSLSFT